MADATRQPIAASSEKASPRLAAGHVQEGCLGAISGSDVTFLRRAAVRTKASVVKPDQQAVESRNAEFEVCVSFTDCLVSSRTLTVCRALMLLIPNPETRFGVGLP